MVRTSPCHGEDGGSIPLGPATSVYSVPARGPEDPRRLLTWRNQFREAMQVDLVHVPFRKPEQRGPLLTRRLRIGAHLRGGRRDPGPEQGACPPDRNEGQPDVEAKAPTSENPSR